MTEVEKAKYLLCTIDIDEIEEALDTYNKKGVFHSSKKHLMDCNLKLKGQYIVGQVYATQKKAAPIEIKQSVFSDYPMKSLFRQLYDALFKCYTCKQIERLTR